MRSVTESIDRKPAVAGTFYPADSEKLQQEVESLFQTAMPCRGEYTRAVITPHAGYQFSGGVAASAYNQINGEIPYKRVFIIASSHHVSFQGASVYCDGDYIMPYGRERVDKAFGKMLVTNFQSLFTSDREPHIEEHGIEVQLPFLHHVMKNRYTIVPIIIGSNDAYICKEIARVLKPYFTPDNLFIISTDFSHYPDYENAVKVDESTKEVIISNSPEKLQKYLRESEEASIPNLITSLCGWTSVFILLNITKGDKAMRYNAIEYKNSGDSPVQGDHSKVVGYWAISVSEKANADSIFELSDSDKKVLLNIAGKSVELAVQHKRQIINEREHYSDILNTKCGVFVTLHKNGVLRGCLGRLKGEMPLWKLVQEMAYEVPEHDYRFAPVQPSELPDIEIEISVLSPLLKVRDISQIKLGRHGIQIVKGADSGVFLPQVATETGWDLEEFLGHCSRDKAGIGWEGWKEADIYVFSATVFK